MGADGHVAIVSAPRLEALWAQHTGDLLGYALRRTNSREDAVDVVSEVFLVAWRRIEEIPDDTEVRLWVFGVARNLLANQRRGERRRTALAIRLAMHLDTLAPPPVPTVDTGVRVALGRLKEVDREILTLTAWDGLTPAEARRCSASPRRPRGCGCTGPESGWPRS